MDGTGKLGCVDGAFAAFLAVMGLVEVEFRLRTGIQP